jgi:HSP20 family protein
MSQTLPERRRSGATERWGPMSDLTERMRRLLDETFGDGGIASLAREAGVWIPDVDIEEQDDAYVIEAELPGVKREDVNIELVGNEILVTGEIKERERQGVLRRRTRRRGSFELRVALPDRVDGDRIDAHLENGVLTVRVPKSEAAQRRRIEVQQS